MHKLRALEYLLAVVDHGGFAPAARQLGVASPSIHRLVNSLERELGTALLDRSTQPFRPTPDGAEYVARARHLLSELQQLDSALRDRANAPSGQIVVAAHNVVTEFVLSEALPPFHEQFPGVQIDLRDAGHLRDLAQLDADILLQFGWPPPQDAIVRTLAHTRWLVVATPGFWNRHGVPKHPEDLSQIPCALFRTPFGEILRQWSFTRGSERASVTVDGWLLGDNRAALDAPVLAGQIAARVNDLTVSDWLRSGRLQPVLLDWHGLHAPPLTMLFRRALSRHPRVRAFVDHMSSWTAEATRVRLPAGLPPVQPAQPPDWFKRRVR